ncbi:PEP-CTERM sorting domain-containing protein [Botrimarina sp.]|uniref:PEP-CTERM sorting domain-containing protein n=1 Tax=Botrimarina sp. TaxID=2795802 RepID=UPI0032EA91E5
MSRVLVTTVAVLVTACVAGRLHAQPANIQTWIEFPLSAVYDAAGVVDQDASDESLDAVSNGGIGLVEVAYGDITGNTIDRAAFAAAVSNAHAAGLGGVLTFDSGSATYSGVDYQHPTAGAINRRGGASLKIGDIFVERGPNWYFEGGAVTPYRGRATGDFDGTGPSGPDRLNFDEVFFVREEASGTLGQTTSWDLDFDPADQVTTVGWTMLNYNNFQSTPDGIAAGGYPPVHGRATFTNGVDSVTHMAIAQAAQVEDGFDHYFGFQAPEGYFLDRIEAYQIGNNSRAFPGLDDLGFVRVPEPAAIGLAAMVMATAALRRRS